jgi:hypothetical protein
MRPTLTLPRPSRRLERELDEWIAVLNPKLVVEAERKFALTVRGIMADAAVELLVDEFEELRHEG